LSSGAGSSANHVGRVIGGIVGGVVAGVVFLVALIVGAILFLLKRRGKKSGLLAFENEQRQELDSYEIKELPANPYLEELRELEGSRPRTRSKSKANEFVEMPLVQYK
jgi:hypothetical protein